MPTVSTEQQLFDQSEIFLKANRYREAMECLLPLLRAKIPRPQMAMVKNNIGRIYLHTGQLEIGIDYLKKADREFPNAPDILGNLALAHKWKHDMPAAKEYVTRALKINPWHNAAQFTQAMISLVDGDYEKGFEQYECRWRDKNNNLRKPETNALEWGGVKPGKVYIYGEQGSGDSILMLRYARLIRARGCWQAWVTQNGMRPLTQTIPEIDQVVEVGDPFPDYDYILPAASLPRVFKTTIDSIPPAPYLPRPEPEQFGSGFHVGIIWRGAVTQLNDKFRSTNLDLWQSVLAVPGVTFHSLQMDNADEALMYPVIVQHEKPKDWLETARRVCGMDLIISVDTSMVHLCGALNVPCWVAMHSRPYFVFPLHRDDCPWYPSLRLFKSKKDFDWLPVFQRIANELQCLVNC